MRRDANAAGAPLRQEPGSGILRELLGREGTGLSHPIGARATFKSPLPVLNPASVAIVGASERARWPQEIHANLKAAGYPGPIYPINPRLKELWGGPCYPDLASLPRPAAHALIIVPAPAVLEALEKGVAAGLKSATVYAGNIGEGSDPEIVARGEALRALVARSGLAVNGPNCMGGNALRERFFGYPNADFVSLPPGTVACVSQSGGTMQFLCKTAAERGVKFSHMFSSGNEIDLDLADFVDYFTDEPHTKIIALFIEGIRRPQMFMRAAARALAAGKPIIAIKTGKSQKSRDAAQSHTGAIAGDYDGFLAMCGRHGIVAVDSLDDMVETMLVFQGGRTAGGNRVGWVTTSGGTVDLLHDYIEAAGGIVSPEFSAATKSKIRHLVPPDLALKNPLDAGIPSTDANAVEMCAAVAADPGVDILAWAAVLPGGRRASDAKALRAIVDSTSKPVVAFGRMAYALGPEALAFQDEAGFPYLQGLPATVRALGALAFHGARSGRGTPALPEPRGAAAAIEGDGPAAALAARGLPAPRSAFAATPRGAGEAAARIGFPAAVKIVSPQFSHKTEIGGVRLGLASREAAERAAEEMERALRAIAPDALIEGFLIQEMVSGVEMILGVREDPLYGPLMLAGAGGIFVELMRDTAFRLLPLSANDARAMLAGLRVSKLLDGFRGQPAADVDALVGAMLGLSDFYLDHRQWLSGIEINPLIVLARGLGARAVDTRITRR